MLYIAPYNMGSESAKLLARELGVLRIRGDKWLKRGSIILNWGRSELEPKSRWPVSVINEARAVANAKNKLKAFELMRNIGVPIPEFTTNPEQVRAWLRQESVVYGRAQVAGQGGAGIHILTPETTPIPNLPLYTRGIVKAHEYRVHVFNGRVIDFAKKRRRADKPDASSFIKNYENGWVFCRDGVFLPEQVRRIAIDSTRAMGLHFGALDIVMKNDMPYVLEINTAPGIEGSTLNSYVRAIRSMYDTQDIRRVRGFGD